MVAGVGAGCAEAWVITPVVRFASPATESLADRVELFITSAPCPASPADAWPPTVAPGGLLLGPRVVRRGGVGEAFGGATPGAAAFVWARAVDANCAVIAAGCAAIDLTRSGESPVVLQTLATPQSLCRGSERCEAGRCVAGADVPPIDAAGDGAADDLGPARSDGGDASTLDGVASTDAPSTDAPSTDAPSTDAPSTDGPRCEAPLTLCNGQCVALGTDAHCRDCGDACGGPDVRCCDRMCVNVRSNNNHCGRCNNPCGGRDDRCCRSTCMQVCP